MKLFIKNMVCPRCIMSVEQILKEHKIETKYVQLGEIELVKTPGKKQLQNFSESLQKVGFELLDDARTQLIDKIKTLLIQKVQDENIEDHFSINKYLTKKIFKDYSSISKLFSEVEGVTIEQFFILQKIEKIKERLVYNELSLGEIALNLGYSSTQHLSGQFKKLTGMTPTQFKSLGSLHRKPIDKV
ncbi:MAG: helix-turn-helix transcriptional regulator [Ginsengibacter sp.]